MAVIDRDRPHSEDCQNSQEASGQKDHSHADSRPAKNERIREAAKVINPAKKLTKLLNEYSGQGFQVFSEEDVLRLFRANWLELSWYAHAIHDELEGESK